MTAIAGRVDFVPGRGASTTRLAEAMAGRLVGRPGAVRLLEFASGAFAAPAPNRTTSCVAQPPGAIAIADARLDDVRLDATDHGPEAPPTSPDEAAILVAYARWGHECARHLRGDFAFALWDPDLACLLLARSPLGSRSLYFQHDGSSARFASEAHAIFVDDALVAEPNLEAVALFLANAYTDNGPTLWRHVSSVPPGHSVRIDARGATISCDWALDPFARRPVRSDEALAEELADALDRAIARRTVRARRVGVQLSGGLDSAAIASEAERLRREGATHSTPVSALHLAFRGLPCDETPHSRAVVARWGLTSIELDALEDPSWTAPHRATELGRPPYFPGAYAFEALLAAAAANGIDAVLTGEGGDLCLGPTGLEFAEALASGDVRAVRRRLLANPLEARAWQRSVHLTVRQLVPWRLRALAGPLRPMRRDAFLSDRWNEAVAQHQLDREVFWEGQPFPDRPTRSVVRALHESGQQAGTARLAHFARRHGIALEHPFLDPEVVRLLVSMPPEHRHAPLLRKPKPVLRRAMRDRLPASVYRRGEAAEYSSFIAATLFGRHAGESARLLRPSRLVELGLLRSDVSLDPPRTGDPAALCRMLAIAAMELWLRQIRP